MEVCLCWVLCGNSGCMRGQQACLSNVGGKECSAPRPEELHPSPLSCRAFAPCQGSAVWLLSAFLCICKRSDCFLTHEDTQRSRGWAPVGSTVWCHPAATQAHTVLGSSDYHRGMRERTGNESEQVGRNKRYITAKIEDREGNRNTMVTLYRAMVHLLSALQQHTAINSARFFTA